MVGPFDDEEFGCELTVELPDGESFVIEFPCGSVFDTKVTSDPGTLVTQMPLRYQVLRERAILKPCCWWRDTEVSPEDLENEDLEIERSLPDTFAFTIVPGEEQYEEVLGTDGDLVVGGWAHETTPSFRVAPFTFETELINGAGSVPTKCAHPAAANWHQGNDGAPPCNGAKTQCPYYTGPAFKYINDEDLRPGKSIIGQQVQELRSLTTDWTVVPNAEEVWEAIYDSPYIWGRDFDDLPVILDQGEIPEQIDEVGISANLVRIKWNTSSEDAELSVFPSTPGDPNAEGEDTPIEDSDTVTPPKYYTIVGNLAGSTRPPLEITFPPTISSQGNLFEAGFTFDSMNSTNHTMYLSGISLSVVNVYIVNTSIASFPVTSSDSQVPDEEISTAILNLVEQLGYLGLRSGFRVATTGADRFWHLPEGIDLKPNQINKIVVLVRSGSVWNFLAFNVRYGFHQLDLVQQGHTSIIPVPQTQSIVTGWANLTSQSPIIFRGLTYGGNPTIKKAYHYYVFDRSLSRLISAAPETKPDRRYWTVAKTSHSITGNGKGEGNLRWSKLDNCNTFLIEILNPKPSAAKPAGIDRGWEPRLIKLMGQEEVASGHGEGQSVDVVLRVLDGPGEIGRSIDGSLFPTRFLIVRPVDDQNIGTPSKEAEITVELDIFEANNVGEANDDFEEIRLEFPEDSGPSAGGIRVNGLGENVVLAEDPEHSISILGDSLAVTATKYDISYMVEIAGPSGEVLGRKWIYGVSELCQTWVRDVDIKYAWSAVESSQTLTPDYARATAQLNKAGKVFDPGDPQTTEGGLHTYLPRCGDHEGRWLFSPYEGCEQSKFYLNDGGIILNGEIPTGVVWDERYRGPMQQEPFTVRHNPAGVITKCVFEWTMGTKTRVSPTWAGFARLRGPITEFSNAFLYSQYLVKNWVLPQFGNKGRDHIRVYRTMHFREYVYSLRGRPVVAAGWMPAIPFIGSTGVFDDVKPRTFFDYSAETHSLPTIDYHSYAGQGQAIGAGAGNTLPSASNIETLTFNRVTYDVAFDIRRPGQVGDGIQWPPDGWYFNPKDVRTLWGFPEPVTDVAREFSGEFLRGIIFRKPRPEGQNLLFDRFGRPIDVGPIEGEIEIKFSPTEVDAEGNIKEYATVYIQEDFPLFFDMYTGEVKNLDLEGNPTIYSGLTPAQFQAILEELGIQADIVPVYPPLSNAEEEALPENITELIEIAFYGNIASDMSKCYVYAVNGPAGNNIDDEDVQWKGFFRSVELQDIRVNLLPSMEVSIEEDPVAEGAIGIFGNYPSTDPVLRGIFSGIEQPALGGNPPLLGSHQDRSLKWEPYSESDLQLGDSSQGTGSIGPISNTVNFPSTTKIVAISFSYELVPRQQGNIFPGEFAGPFTDPQVVLKLVGDTDVILLEKPKIRLTGDGTTITRVFVFDEEDMEPTNVNQIILEVGARDDATGIYISPFEVRITKVIPATEIFRTVNPKVIVSRGYGSDVDTGVFLPSQHQYLSAITTTPDQPDRVEVSNIAELWQPGMASTDQAAVVGTKGKIRRHWASGFLSYDTLKRLDLPTDPAFFVDSDVFASEARQ